MKRLSVLIGLLLLGPAHAEEYEDIVSRAFEAINGDFHNEWAFTETSTADGSTSVGRYDPRRAEGERWTLSSVDDREPTEDEVDAYLDGKTKDAERGSGNERGADTRIAPGTLRLIEEHDGHWLFSFVPAGDKDDDEGFMEHVDGTIKIAKDGHYVEYIDLRNSKPIKPAFGVKIITFLTRLTFGPAAPDGPIVPQTVDVHVKGRAYLAVRFDEKESVRYGDYSYAAD